MLEHPAVFASCAVKGFLDDLYATLVLKLADSESFQLKELWRGPCGVPEDGRAVGKEMREFADVRWMEISSVLKRESQNGTKPVK